MAIFTCNNNPIKRKQQIKMRVRNEKKVSTKLTFPPITFMKNLGAK